MVGSWRPIQDRGSGTDAFVVTPFRRLARAHALAVAGDTLIAIALAGSLFFSIDPAEARSRVFLYLALTMAPFAVVAPLVGPALDRTPGGRRWMVVASSALRAVVCLLLIDDVDSLLLFPEAFALLVLAKSYHVAKSALVPTVVQSDDELVEANSKLSLISGLAGLIAAIPGGILYQLGGSAWTLGLAVAVFVVGTFVGLALPGTTVAPEEASQEERDELRSAGVLLAASAMGLLRGIVGFLTFLLAFSLRTGDAPSWHFGVVLAVSVFGALAGAAIAPPLRRATTEERMLGGVLAVVALVAVGCAWLGGLPGASIVAATVGVGASTAKLAFDSIVQRDAPDANRGRSFARFETRFQLFWVVGAVLGIIAMPAWLGYAIVAGTAAFAAVSYTAGSRTVATARRRRSLRLRRRSPAPEPVREPAEPTPLVPPTVALPGPPGPPVDPTEVLPTPGADPTLVDGAPDQRR